MRLRLRSAARLAVVPLAAALVLGACARPGTVATVNGARISDTELAQAVSEFQRLGLEADPRNTLNVLISVGPLLDVAGELGLGVSAAEGAGALDQVAVSNGVEPFEYSDTLVNIARTLYLNQVTDPAAQQTIAEALVSAEVTVNPRFGTFGADGRLTPTQWEWLVADDDAAPAAG